MALAPENWLAGAELGQRFGDARLLRAGSRFSIFAAVDRETGRQVAVKVPDDPSGTWLHEILAGEAAILSELGAHPHILTCYGSVRLDDGRPALLLERCSETLADAMHEHEPMDVRRVVATGIKLAGALESVHQFGVLHCDVRPGTVFLDAGGEPVLAGFDEAVQIRAADSRPPLHHLTSHTAPEILEGAAPSTSSDVYGLASTLYELVAGRAAFRAYAGESAASVIVRVLSSTVAPIIAPNVPLEISDLLTWSLSPDPGDRPPSPVWIAEELGRVERREGWPRTRMTTV